jgi:hypothetical protein
MENEIGQQRKGLIRFAHIPGSLQSWAGENREANRRV